MKKQTINFKWKTWYWYFAPASTSLMVLFLSIYMILFSQLNEYFLEGILYPLFIFFTVVIILILIIAYTWLANKDFIFHQKKLLNVRFKYLVNGSLTVILSLVLYLVSLVISYAIAKTHYDFVNVQTIKIAYISLYPGEVSTLGFLGIMLAFIILVNFSGILFWTFFQFTIAFDIFKNNNFDHIQKISKSKNDKPHEWDEITKANYGSLVKKGVNKWTYFVEEYEAVRREKNENE